MNDPLNILEQVNRKEVAVNLYDKIQNKIANKTLIVNKTYLASSLLGLILLIIINCTIVLKQKKNRTSEYSSMITGLSIDNNLYSE